MAVCIIILVIFFCVIENTKTVKYNSGCVSMSTFGTKVG